MHRHPLKGIAEFVIVEASSHDEANRIAEDIGLYFNGVEDGRDCDCCGERWYPACEVDGQDTPLYFKSTNYFTKDNCFIHYLNGTFLPWGKKDE